MTFLYEYLMFLGQVVTLVIGFIVVASFLASLGNRAQSGRQGHLQVQKLNEQIRDLRFAMESRLMTSDQAKKLHKSELKAEKAEQKKQPKDAPKPNSAGIRQRVKAGTGRKWRGICGQSGCRRGVEEAVPPLMVPSLEPSSFILMAMLPHRRSNTCASK